MIRGNVPTRLLKVCLIMNMMRFLSLKQQSIEYINMKQSNKKETKKFFNLFKKFKPFILPLSVFPTAVYNRAIAVVFKKR